MSTTMNWSVPCGTDHDARWKSVRPALGPPTLDSRSAGELANTPGHPALKIGSAHKKKFESWLAGRITADGFDDAALRARQVMILLDGAVARLLIHRDPTYAHAAGQAAAALLADNKVKPRLAASGR